MPRTATCVWRADATLVLALDEHLGPPVDSYLNGSQTWITDDGPGDESLEWRLHPVAGYRLPRDLSRAATAAIERPPDAVGLVDHERIGTAWEDARGTTSIVEMVFAELKSAT
jgi:hypothetical protein